MQYDAEDAFLDEGAEDDDNVEVEDEDNGEPAAGGFARKRKPASRARGSFARANRDEMVELEAHVDVSVVPIRTTGLRACKMCALVKTAEQFVKSGCENCDRWVSMRNDGVTMEDCTSPVFEGLIGMVKPGPSWVAKYQRFKPGYVAGCYAISVKGEIPAEILADLEEKGYRYTSRDNSQRGKEVVAAPASSSSSVPAVIDDNEDGDADYEPGDEEEQGPDEASDEEPRRAPKEARVEDAAEPSEVDVLISESVGGGASEAEPMEMEVEESESAFAVPEPIAAGDEPSEINVSVSESEGPSAVEQGADVDEVEFSESGTSVAPTPMDIDDDDREADDGDDLPFSSQNSFLELSQATLDPDAE